MSTIEIWHEIVKERNPHRLDEVLAPECVFFSPVMHAPQKGKELTKFYLTGAMMVFNDSFHYVKQVITAEHAVLEFNCEIDGIIINGVDILTFDEAGMITEFKVMIRPLKALNLLHSKMNEMLNG
jgi:hypothetical protein